MGDLKLESGEVIKDFTISYVTHGALNARRSNVILMVTALTGNHHRLDFLIGPGKALDTTKYFVVATDAIGNGLTTSPSNSKAQPRMQFPKFGMRDMVESQRRLLKEKLGIDHVVAVIGPSMGGMQALQWGVSHPDVMDSLVALVPLARTPAWSVLLVEATRKAIMLDPAWNNGNYTSIPVNGVRLWREILGFGAEAEDLAPQTNAVDGDARVVAVVPRGVEHDGLAGGLDEQHAPRRRARQRHQGDQAVHDVRMRHAPLERLHPAHRGTDHGHHVVDAELLLEQPALRLHHVAHPELRKLHARLRLAVARRSREPVADGVGGDHEVLRRVQRLARPDEEVQAVMVAGQRRHHEDRVRLPGVERAVGDVGDREILDDLAALQLEIPHRVGLVRGVAGLVGEGGGGGQEHEGQDEEMGHGGPPSEGGAWKVARIVADRV